MTRRLSAHGVAVIRATQLSAIGIVLDAESIQRPNEEEFRLSIDVVSKRSGIPLYRVRILGRDHFTELKVPGRVVGYKRGEFYVADDEANHRRRHPECYDGSLGRWEGIKWIPASQMIDPLARADTIGNMPGYHDGETWIPEGG